ncbi:unnamed protein product [Pocillopora meandrina]|uniref:Protein kinase domain-containing protein n=1 Tax=Pocillopora meandrina TaxID=46732 RepID=A0AAU9X4Y9_9CNID|nr:unnamed protein product [Pocillopora meandrina]
MSSNPSKPSLKRPAESEINDEKDDSLDKAEEGFRIKTLDEIRLEKRRRLEKDDASGEERNGSPTDNSGTASPVDSARRDRKPSSKQSSPAVQGTESEVIYQLSPEQTSLSSASSPSRTPKKLKQPSYHDGGTSGVQVNRRRKTEEEEGEIVSDPSDSESRRSESRSRRYSSISNPEVEEKHEATEQRGKDDSSEEEDSDEEESEEDTETATATKRVQQGRKEMAEGKKESSVSESGSDSEESSSDDDDDDGDEKMEEVVSKSEQKESKVKQQREPALKKSAPKEMVSKKNDDDDEGDESSSEEEDSSEEESEEEESEEDESESDSSEESEQEQVNKEVVEKTETMKTEEVREKGKGQVKYQGDTESRHSQSKSKGRSYEKGRSDQVAVDLKHKESRDKHRSYPKDSTKLKSERPDAREKQSKMDVERRKKDRSRKDSEKRVRSSTEDSLNHETKGKDRKNYSGSKRSSSASEKSNKESKDVEEDVPQNEPKKEEGKSLILTDRERRQFTNEVVDIESEGSSVEDEKQGVPSDVEMKLSDGDIVALKKLKMEREKEGFPITSLREINTLLKAQHPNIVTVREIVVGSNMDKIYIVMDYVEHDLKVLMEHMTQGFRIGEIKTLMIQLLRAVAHLHDNWILHRDLKASNLLLSNKGILKVGDFGLAREYGSPLKNYTPVVVTLWYRAPELLLGTKEYSTPIDLWSVGCIFAELLTMKPLFPGKSEIDQINRIFKELGTPSDKIWPGPPSYSELPAVQKMTFTDYPYNNLRNRFGAYLTDKGFDLLNRFLTYDPDKDKRITAENALKHAYFSESPQPVDPSMFPTWPAKSEMAKRPKRKDVEHSPKAPEGGAMFAKLADEGDSGSGSLGFRMPTSQKGSAAVAGFTLKF